MKIEQVLLAGIAVWAANPGMAASLPDANGVPVEMVVTARPAKGKPAQTLEAADLKVTQGKTTVRVVELQRLAGDWADMQLFVLLDDSTRSTSLGLQLPELKKFVESLPATTRVAIGYMHNGTFGLSQAFTPDHAKAASTLRLPAGIPGDNGSPYFALSDLVKHWPSKEPAKRRAVLMMTDGVDRYYDASVTDDPYADTAITDALKQGVMVYSIYLRGAGAYGRGGWTTNVAQSRLIEVSQETGGYAYFQDFTDPVTIEPFMQDLRERLANQYLVTISAVHEKGVQPVKLRTELPGMKVEGPTRIYVP